MIWCEKILEEENFDIDDEENSLCLKSLILFYWIYEIIWIDNKHADDIGGVLQNHVHNNLLHIDEKEHPPIAIFSYTPPTIITSFILHIMLSIGSDQCSNMCPVQTFYILLRGSWEQKGFLKIPQPSKLRA